MALRTERVVPFTTEDGVDLKVTNVRGEREPDRGPVVLVHGAGVRSNLFRAPVETTVVDALVDHGYDVWLEDWRASIDLPPREWDLDQAARYDHPAAVRTVLRETGADTTKAIIHCQGSTSFMMSAASGLLPEVDTIVTNAVSLHPVVPAWSKAKLSFAIPIFARLLKYMDPGWGDAPPKGLDALLVAAVKLAHTECDCTACKLVSFTYGSGYPALWRHDNLNDATHGEWLQREFGDVPMTFFKQMARCVRAGQLVRVRDLDGLPRRYASAPPQTGARMVFYAGLQNRCFLAESQRRTFAWWQEQRPGRHSLHVLPTYSHLDVFLGKDAGRDVFPTMLAELDGEAA